MASSSFVSRAPTFLTSSRDHSLMGYAPYSSSSSSSSSSSISSSSYGSNLHSQVDPQALFPSFGTKQQLPSPSAAQFGVAPRMPSPLSVSVSISKLPSLEGLLKKMQQPDAPVSPPARSQQPQRLSPSGREMAAMPSLRALISPSVSHMSSPSQSQQQQQQQQVPSQQQFMGFPSRKRSWLDANASSAYPVKARRAVSPALSVRSPSSESQLSASPRGSSASVSASVSAPSAPRSRASKYCKIEGCERVSQRNNLCHSHGGKRLCKEENCSSKDRGNGYCIKHGGGKICSMASCEKKARRKGLCTQHFRVCEDDDDDEGDDVMSTDGGGMDGMAALHYASTI